MTSTFIALASRAVIRLTGEAWRDFLQGLITQDVSTLAPGELRFGALLTPQGRLAFDLFVSGDDAGALVECQASTREALIQRLILYRLRAKVSVEADPAAVGVLFGTDSAPQGWLRDPRAAGLGWRGYGLQPPAGARIADEAGYKAHKLALAVPGPADWAGETTYPIEANFDLLAGIDFKKGCYVGQETTSRMKRRGQIKSRMAPIAFDGPPPPPGSELLAGELRAGEALSGGPGRAMALLRLDRLTSGPLTLVDGRPFRPELPEWMRAE